MKITELTQKVKRWLLDILFPITELPAGIKIHQTLFCSVCRARLPENQKICHRDAKYLLGAASSYADENVRRLIWQLKYRGRTGNSVLLAKLLTNYVGGLNLQLKNYLIIPLPLSQKRERQRGYNQAKLIAEILAEKFNLPLENTALVRQKDTLPQMEIKDWDQRKLNVLNCFGVAKPHLIKGKNIILIDDVFTSGATMNEAAHALKDFGAKQIIAFVVAKAG